MLIALLKKKSGITREEYMKMDKTDMEKACTVAGLNKEESDAVWEQLPDTAYKDMMLKARVKNGV